MTRFTDRAALDGALVETADGWAVQARVARGGNVQVYLGSEMGLVDRATVRVYRPESEVFDRKAFATYARKPITIGHPADGVSPDNWKRLAVGEIDRDVVRDGEFVSVPLLFRDAEAVAKLQAADGPRELSMGYDAKIEMRDGVTPDGEAYDAVMSEFRMNHVAVVPLARGGSDLRIGDGAASWGASPVHDKATTSNKKEDDMSDALKTVVLGDQAVQVAVSDASVIEKFKADHAKALTDAASAHATEIAAKDAELAKLQAALDAVQSKVLTDAEIDAKVAERAALVATAKAIAPDLKTDGLTDAAIRKAAVVAKIGDAAIAGKSDAYIDARFEIMAEDAGKADPVADALAAPAKSGSAISARDQMIADLKAGKTTDAAA